MPEIRTSLAIPTEPWERAKNRFLEDLGVEERRTFQSATLETIFHQAEVEYRGYQQSSKLQACRHRLQPLLDALNAYGKGLDVISSTGTVSMIMAPLWGGIRVSLQMAQESEEFFANIVDMLTEIGHALPHLRDYERLFPQHERLLAVISEAYLIVISFCTDVKELFMGAKRSKTSKISLTLPCKSLWKPFTSKFQDYLKEFEQINIRVKKEAGQAHMTEAKKERQLQQAHRAELVRQDKQTKIRSSLDKASPFDYEAFHRRVQAVRHTETTKWIFGQPSFMEWLEEPRSSSFGCFGIPCSGKTVASSGVIDHLTSTSLSSFLCYHYCTYEDVSSLSITSILGVLLHQAFEDSLRSTEARYLSFWERLSRTRLLLLDELFSVFCEFLSSKKSIIIILDGLDELENTTQDELSGLLEQILGLPGCLVKIFVSCRPEAVSQRKAFHPSFVDYHISRAHLQRHQSLRASDDRREDSGW